MYNCRYCCCGRGRGCCRRCVTHNAYGWFLSFRNIFQVVIALSYRRFICWIIGCTTAARIKCFTGIVFGFDVIVFLAKWCVGQWKWPNDSNSFYWFFILFAGHGIIGSGLVEIVHNDRRSIWFLFTGWIFSFRQTVWRGCCSRCCFWLLSIHTYNGICICIIHHRNCATWIRATECGLFGRWGDRDRWNFDITIRIYYTHKVAINLAGSL